MTLFDPQDLLPQNSLQIIPILQITSSDILHFSILISLGIAIGIVVGLSLGLIGGGGSILAVPLLIYLIGLEPHVAIGTSALVVGINALISFFDHKKKGHVLLKKSLLFAIPGVVGTLIGSYIGLLTPSSSLLILFAIFMMAMAVKLLIANIDRKKSKDIKDNVFKKIIESKYDKTSHQKQLDLLSIQNNFDTKKRYNSLKVAIIGVLVGLAAGYFGIGGGFLIVPSLMYLDVNIINSIGTSLLPVSFFGLATAANYTISGQVDFLIAMLLVCGGLVGGKVGTALSSKASKKLLTTVFSMLLLTVAVYMIIKIIVW
jgi:hypothetical protein